MKLLITIGLCVIIGAQSLSIPLRINEQPSFCRDDDCPKFSVVDKQKDYEERKYEPTKWVATLVPSMKWTDAIDEGYSRLYAYRTGKNKENKTIPMATPVATKIEPGQGPACKSNFTILFFVPFAFQENTPEPTDSRVSILALPSLTAYVGSFKGDETELVLQEQASNLVVALQDNKVDINTDVYFTAEYEGPDRKTEDHYNEVWFLANN